MTDPLPHDPYITVVCDALTAAGLSVQDGHTDDCETRGTHCFLNAVITLDPGAAWPHGLLLIWEWHIGEDPERGPSWQFAALKEDGSSAYPTDLPVHGYASPAAIVDAARKVIDRSIGPGDFHNLGQPEWDGGIIGGTWEHRDQLDAACEAWAADEVEDATDAARYEGAV